MKEELNELVGETVTLAISSAGIVRRHFVSQISLRGTLEVNDSQNVQYRVLRDNDTFAYFDINDVVLINPLVSTGVVIFLDFTMEE